jgi:urease accessory protein UreH
MRISPQLQAKFETMIAHATEYRVGVNLNLYDSPSCTSLATQASSGRHLQICSKTITDHALEVKLCEDAYLSWLPVEDITHLSQQQQLIKQELFHLSKSNNKFLRLLPLP